MHHALILVSLYCSLIWTLTDLHARGSLEQISREALHTQLTEVSSPNKERWSAYLKYSIPAIFSCVEILECSAEERC